MHVLYHIYIMSKKYMHNTGDWMSTAVWDCLRKAPCVIPIFQHIKESVHEFL